MKQALEQAGFAVVDPAEAAMCCGSAGSYSLLQPQLAGALRARKADTLAATGADVVAAGNIGCLMQIGDSAGRPALHPAELLDWAAGGPRPNALNPVPPAPPSSRAGRQGSSPPGAAPL